MNVKRSRYAPERDFNGQSHAPFTFFTILDTVVTSHNECKRSRFTSVCKALCEAHHIVFNSFPQLPHEILKFSKIMIFSDPVIVHAAKQSFMKYHDKSLWHRYGATLALDIDCEGAVEQ